MAIETSATQIIEPVRASVRPGRRIWAFGGGKGGIGKSFVTSNVAVCLAHLGHSVTLVDLDLGGANLHTCIGSDLPRFGLGDFLSQAVSQLSEVSVETKIPRLKLVGGFNDSQKLFTMDEAAKRRLIESVHNLTTDFVFLDLGAGTVDYNLDFFLGADHSVIVTAPEPTSIENSYQFIRSTFYRKVKTLERELGIQRILEDAMENRAKYLIRTPADLIKHIIRVEPHAGEKIRKSIESLRLELLINQVRANSDRDIGVSMTSVCRSYFGLQMNSLGYIEHDNAVWQSLRKKEPLVLAFPYSQLTSILFNIAKSLVESQKNSAIL